MILGLAILTSCGSSDSAIDLEERFTGRFSFTELTFEGQLYRADSGTSATVTVYYNDPISSVYEGLDIALCGVGMIINYKDYDVLDNEELLYIRDFDGKPILEINKLNGYHTIHTDLYDKVGSDCVFTGETVNELS